MDTVEKKPFDRAAHCRKIAHLGGKATYEKYGRGYYKKVLGPNGLTGLANSRFDGNRVLAWKVVQFMKDPDRNVRNPKYTAAELADLKAWVKSLSS